MIGCYCLKAKRCAWWGLVAASPWWMVPPKLARIYDGCETMFKKYEFSLSVSEERATTGFWVLEITFNGLSSEQFVLASKLWPCVVYNHPHVTGMPLLPRVLRLLFPPLDWPCSLSFIFPEALRSYRFWDFGFGFINSSSSFCAEAIYCGEVF